MLIRSFIILFFLFILPADGSTQYFSQHINLGEGNVLPFDYGNQLLVSGDTIYMKAKRFVENKEVVVIVMLDKEGHILGSRHINWGIARDSHNMLLDGDRLIYAQSDDDYSETEREHGVQLLVMDRQLDSLSYHYYPAEFSAQFFFCEPLVIHKDKLVIGTTVVHQWYDNDVGLLFLDRDDLNLDTIRYPELGRDPDVRYLKSVGDKLILGYTLYDDQGIPNNENYVSALNSDYKIDWTWDQSDYNWSALGLRSHFPSIHEFLFHDNKIIFQHDQEINNCIDASTGELLWNAQTENIKGESYRSTGYMGTNDGNVIEYGKLRKFDTESDTSKIFMIGYIHKIDMVDGSTIWDRALVDYNDNGAAMGHGIEDVIELENGDLMGIGISYPNKGWNERGGGEDIDYSLADTWLFKVDNEGCFQVLACDDLYSYTSSLSDEDKELFSVTLFPDPVSDILNLAIDDSYHELQYYILDLHGRIIDHGNVDNTNTVDVSELPQGIHILHLKTQKGYVVKKFIKG